MIDPKIFKAYDIRGIYPTELNEAAAYAIARAFYTLFSQKLQKNGLKMRVQSITEVLHRYGGLNLAKIRI